MWLDAPAPFARSVGVLRDNEQRITGDPGIEGVVLRYGFFYGPGTYLRLRRLDRRSRCASASFPIVGKRRRDELVRPRARRRDRDRRRAGARARASTTSSTTSRPRARDWLPVYARAIGAKPPRRVPPGSLACSPAEIVGAADELRGASNAKAKAELGWQPALPSWREGFTTALDSGPSDSGPLCDGRDDDLDRAKRRRRLRVPRRSRQRPVLAGALGRALRRRRVPRDAQAAAVRPRPYELRMRLLEADPPNRLRWEETDRDGTLVVEYELAATPSGTRFSPTHRPLGALSSRPLLRRRTIPRHIAEAGASAQGAPRGLGVMHTLRAFRRRRAQRGTLARTHSGSEVRHMRAGSRRHRVTWVAAPRPGGWPTSLADQNQRRARRQRDRPKPQPRLGDLRRALALDVHPQAHERLADDARDLHLARRRCAIEISVWVRSSSKRRRRTSRSRSERTSIAPSSRTRISVRCISGSSAPIASARLMSDRRRRLVERARPARADRLERLQHLLERRVDGRRRAPAPSASGRAARSACRAPWRS